MQVQQPGMSCATALAARLPIGQYKLFRTQVITVTGTMVLNPAPTLFDATELNWGLLVVNLYKDPNYVDTTNTWHTVGTSTVHTPAMINPVATISNPKSTMDQSVKFTSGDRIVLTSQLAHNFLRDKAQMALKKVTVATIAVSSPYANCLDPTIPAASGIICPTGEVATSADYAVWAAYLLSISSTALNPISKSFYLVEDFVPGLTFASGTTSDIQMCKYDVAPAVDKVQVGLPLYYCYSNNGWDANYYCGSDSAPFESSTSKPANHVDSTYPHLLDLTASLNEGGVTLTGPQPATDAVSFSISNFPANSHLVYELQAALHLCPVNTALGRLLRGSNSSDARKLAAVSAETTTITSSTGAFFINYGNMTIITPSIGVIGDVNGGGSGSGAYNVHRNVLVGGGMSAAFLVFAIAFGVGYWCKKQAILVVSH